MVFALFYLIEHKLLSNTFKTVLLHATRLILCLKLIEIFSSVSIMGLEVMSDRAAFKTQEGCTAFTSSFLEDISLYSMLNDIDPAQLLDFHPFLSPQRTHPSTLDRFKAAAKICLELVQVQVEY